KHQRREIVMAKLMVSIISITLIGCGTMANTGIGIIPTLPQNCIYGGVALDAQTAGGGAGSLAKALVNQQALEYPELTFLMTCCAAVDLPLSAIGDTLTLPVTIPMTIQRKSIKEKPNNPANGTDPTINGKPLATDH